MAPKSIFHVENLDLGTPLIISRVPTCPFGAIFNPKASKNRVLVVRTMVGDLVPTLLSRNHRYYRAVGTYWFPIRRFLDEDVLISSLFLFPDVSFSKSNVNPS